jgi:endonuclease III
MRKKAIRSADLGIDLRHWQEGELFKWFLACLLFGKPIQQDVAKRTYFEFVTAGLVTPEAILRAGWDKLVEVLDRGHYVRYDFSTATKLLDICRSLTERYGSLTKLVEQAGSRAVLGRRLQSFKGVGPVTARIFLRDLKAVKRPKHALKSRVPVWTLEKGRSHR